MSERTVLVLGSGGREHALARALASSAISGGHAGAKVVIAPGNGGVSDDPLAPIRREPVELGSNDAVVALAERLRPELVVVGPEAPLVAGVVDALAERGFVAFGPSKAAARLEASKAFLKDFAVRHGIPTARHRTVTTMADAEREIRSRGAPIVIKADGLCAGKGVVVAMTVDEALEAARSMLEEKIFGAAGASVVIEDAIRGREVSVHAITDGERHLMLPPARDHKRIFDGDRGPNTGGMGVVCPASDVSAETLARIEREIVVPTLAGMRAEGTPFRGVLFAGIMLRESDGAPMLLEHNVRFGDPECEAMLELVEGDLFELLASSARGSLAASSASVAPGKHAVVVVLAAAGYPATPVTGAAIDGIDRAEALGAKVHHAGTKRDAGGTLRVSGGRVLAVTASGATFEEARSIAYAGADAIAFEGKQLRRDIGLTRG